MVKRDKFRIESLACFDRSIFAIFVVPLFLYFYSNKIILILVPCPISSCCSSLRPYLIDLYLELWLVSRLSPPSKWFLRADLYRGDFA